MTADEPSMFERLKAAAQTGLDLSPGDPVAAWAVREIADLRQEVARLRLDLIGAREFLGAADPSCIADAALAKILRDLRGRKGIGDEWGEIDVDIRNEMIAEWRGFIMAAVENPLG